jgi:hypothetical protein
VNRCHQFAIGGTMTCNANMMFSLHESLICETQIMSLEVPAQWHLLKSHERLVLLLVSWVTGI